MTRLLSGSTLRKGGSGEFINLQGAQPQLPPSPTTSTGYTLVTDDLLRTSYSSSLGNLEFTSGTIYSNITNQNIVLQGTGTGIVVISSSTQSYGTNTGALVVNGGIGVNKSIWTGEDIHANGVIVGQGWQGLNNVVLTGVGQPQVNEFNIGQSSIAIGFDALQGLSTAYKNIAIGRFALSSGTELSNSIAIGESALKNIGVNHTLPAANISSISNDVTATIVTLTPHNLSSGTYITIEDVVGMTEVNGQFYYVNVIDPSTLTLYLDNILNTSVDSNGYGTYSSGGTVLRNLLINGNIALGNEAGIGLIDGEDNFFLGYKVAQNLTTGSYNFFLGHEVGSNMTRGNANISIGGDNLIDGLNNQINIGSAFYYNGSGYLRLSADTGIGYGTTATNQVFSSGIDSITQSTMTQIITIDPHGVIGGESILTSSVGGMTELNGNIYYVKTPDAYTLSLYSDNLLTTPIDSTGYSSYTTGGTVYIKKIIAALSVSGGVGISDNLIVEGNENSTSTTTGAVVVTGGVGIGGNLNVGGTITAPVITATDLAGGDLGSIPYQAAISSTTFVAIGTTGTVLRSDGLVPYWDTVDFASEPFINEVAATTTYYLALTEVIGDVSPVDSDYNLTYDTTNNLLTVGTISVTGTDTSTSTTTGALLVSGGVGIQGDVYSNTGNLQENYLLYTPQVTISNNGIPPNNARVGDFWIDTVLAAQLQYIKDGTSTFWIQTTTI